MKASINVWRLIMVSLLALTTISPSHNSLWAYDGETLRRLRPQEAGFIEIADEVQAANTGVGGLCLQLQAERVRVGSCAENTTISPWQSPPGWEVREVLVSDLNRDSEEEITLLVWRSFKPWPVDRFMPSAGRIDTFHDNNDMSCHLILIGLRDGKIKELWAGSAMSEPIKELRAVDLDGDGLQELVALEYAYNGNSRKASITVWEWYGFGFSLQARQDGRFSSLLVLPAEQGKLLLAN